jgi:hypothetical protein
MSKKLYAAFVPLLAVVAFAAVPATSQAAEFHWYSNGVRLPFTSAKTQVITWGKLTLTASNGLVITCKKVDAGNVWNVSEATAGKDNTEVFVNYECKSEPEATCAPLGVKTEAKGLPWATELAAGPVDKIKGIEITVTCNGTPVTFTGELSPKVVNGTSAEKPSYDEFTTGTGTLTAPGLTATVVGKDKILGFENQELITVKAP